MNKKKANLLVKELDMQAELMPYLETDEDYNRFEEAIESVLEKLLKNENKISYRSPRKIIIRDYNLFRTYYGIKIEAKTLLETGEIFNITKERSNQIRKKILKKIKYYPKSNRRDIWYDSVLGKE